MRAYLHIKHRLGEALPQRILIVRSLPGLGDMLCFVPALRALRTALPDAHITLIGLPWVADFVRRFQHYVTDWLAFPGYPGIPEVPVLPERTVDFLLQVQQLTADLALQMHGSGCFINGFTRLLGAKRCAGFFPAAWDCPDPNSFLPYPNQEPEIWRHLRLLDFLGIPLQGDHLEFPLQPTDWDELESLVCRYSLRPGRYVCIHPGASVSDRRWFHHHFAWVADRLAAQGMQIVLTGSAAEIPLTKAVANSMNYPAINLAGMTSLGAIAALLKQSRLLICNDTGISHLAAALQVTSIVIFSNSDPTRWAPLNRQRHHVLIPTDRMVEVTDVLDTAMTLLDAEVACAI